MYVVNAEEPMYAVQAHAEDESEALFSINRRDFIGKNSFKDASDYFRVLKRARSGVAVSMSQIVDGRWKTIRECEIGKGISPAIVEFI